MFVGERHAKFIKLYSTYMAEQETIRFDPRKGMSGLIPLRQV